MATGAAIALIVILALVLACAIVGVSYYNSFVSKRNMVEQSYSTIDVFLKKRHDLVPNLVATVQQYMKHEGETLTRIAQLRSRILDPKADTEAKVSADNEMGHLIGNIMLQVENYPDLKSNLNFTELQTSLESMEEQLTASRRAYNASVTNFNTSIEMFPGNIVAGMFGFKRRSVLETPEAERRAPDVKALFRS